MFYYILLLFAFTFMTKSDDPIDQLQGAWKSDYGVLIISGNYFSYAEYDESNFLETFGGSYQYDTDNSFKVFYEYNTEDKEKIGDFDSFQMLVNGKKMHWHDLEFEQIDDGSPGMLTGAWLFTNREVGGSMGTPRPADSPRKTMKILSETRFQWIAYNEETGEFMGTGGGTYTAEDGKYTETLKFFSRDQSKVGTSLVFDFDIKGKEWHHKGVNSKGEPLYEIWTRRQYEVP